MPKREDVILQALRDLNQKMDHQHEVTNSRLVVIEKVQVKQEENLGEHMRRTDLAEENIQLLRDEYKKDVKELENEIKPIKNHVAMVSGVLKGIGILATFVSIIAGTVKVVAFIISLFH